MGVGRHEAAKVEIICAGLGGVFCYFADGVICVAGDHDFHGSILCLVISGKYIR